MKDRQLQKVVKIDLEYILFLCSYHTHRVGWDDFKILCGIMHIKIEYCKPMQIYENMIFKVGSGQNLVDQK